MESINTLDSQSNSSPLSDTLNQLARNQVLATMEKLTHGKLVLVEGENISEFGKQDSELSSLEAVIKIEDQRFYRKVLLGGSVGAAEAYMDKLWTSPNLLNVIRLICRNLEVMNPMDRRGSLVTKLLHKFLLWRHDNSLSGSKKNIAAHYDLSNQFFSYFLSSDMMYSSAIFADPYMNLEEASSYKLESICKKLELKASDHLIEIGTGWGGMAIYAATHYGCKVTTTTISQEQYEYASQRVRENRLEDKITVLNKDYRHLQGSYDKLVSIEMIEAVGHNHYEEYFSQCSKLLKPQGLMLLQAITVPDQRYEYAKSSIDFIKKYIFPGGCLPSNEIIARYLCKFTDMRIVGMEDITEDYAITLQKWQSNFRKSLDVIGQLGFDEKFLRMWDYYFSYCEGGFKERAINTVQVLIAKNNYRFTKIY